MSVRLPTIHLNLLPAIIYINTPPVSEETNGRRQITAPPAEVEDVHVCVSDAPEVCSGSKRGILRRPANGDESLGRH